MAGSQKGREDERILQRKVDAAIVRKPGDLTAQNENDGPALEKDDYVLDEAKVNDQN